MDLFLGLVFGFAGIVLIRAGLTGDSILTIMENPTVLSSPLGTKASASSSSDNNNTPTNTSHQKISGPVS